MSFRLLLAALPAVLAPLGVEGEPWGPDRQALAEARGLRSGWSAQALRRAATAADATSPAPELDGFQAPRSQTGRAGRSSVGKVPGPRPSGLASFGITCRIHLARCGHPADRLDLPPPPRG